MVLVCCDFFYSGINLYKDIKDLPFLPAPTTGFQQNIFYIPAGVETYYEWQGHLCHTLMEH